MLATEKQLQPQQQLGPWIAPSQFSENFQQSLALIQNSNNIEGTFNTIDQNLQEKQQKEILSQKKSSVDLIQQNQEEYKEEKKIGGFNQQNQQTNNNKQIQNQNQSQNLLKKGSKKYFKKKIAINTSRSRSELKLIKILCEKNNWKEVFNDGDVMWSGLDIPYEDISLATEILLNRIPGMKELSHKKMTALFLNKFREYFPNVFDFYPRTYLFPEEYDEIAAAMEKGKQVFIAKPTAGSQGDGITLVKKMKDFPDMRYGNSKEMVVQQYLDKPLIIDNKKFDLRIFVLIASIQPFIVYLCDEGLARFCTQDYELPSQENIKNPYIHLTNYSLNKLNPDYKYTEETTQITDGSKRTLTSIWKSIKKAGHDVEVIKQGIEEVIIRFITSMHPFVLFNYQAAFQAKNTGKCFHLLGFDILLDKNLKPWLIEINANPSLNIEHETDQDYKYKKLQPAIISPVDKYVKEKVMEDALRLVTKTIDSQLLIGVGSSYGCFKQIYVNMVNEFRDMNIFKDILTVYGKVSGFKFNSTITSSKFIKLGKVAGLTTTKFTKQSYDILFTQIMRTKENCQHMDYYDFIEAIEAIAKNIEPNYDPKNKYESVQNLLQKILTNLNQIK